ncbi:flagellar M-ring protein FliF, partial [Salmonella enterica subsp. enterica serovar Poona]
MSPVPLSKNPRPRSATRCERSATASTATQPKPLEWLNRLRANPRIPLIVAGSAAVAIVVAMVLGAKTPDNR